VKQTGPKTIFFHVGTGKTGTKFLQYRVFPRFKGLYYIQRTRYRKAVRIIQRTDHQKYLVSNEFDQQMATEVARFAEHFPETVPIIVFRRHDSYIASQYRRFVKNGFVGSFQDFFDLEQDQGRFKKRDLDYTSQIELLRNTFRTEPIVLIYEDMKNDPKAFIASLAARMQVQVNVDEIDTSRKHSSYSEKQLKAIHWLSQRVDMRKRRFFRNGALHLLWRLYMSVVRYGTLYLGALIPDRMFSERALIDPEELEKVRAAYETDWENCVRTAHGQVKDSSVQDRVVSEKS